MAQINSYYFILLVVFQYEIRETFSHVLRRIVDGKDVSSDKKYAVYLLRATSSPQDYFGWMCGGAILSKDYVLTSAACVQDVKHLYVVAGYKKYISTENMETDECVKKTKKKVILTCVPRDYHFDYNKTELWSKIDIAVIKVESSFDFEDETYENICSYKPQAVEYNTEQDFPKPDDDVIVLGWGHSKLFRKDRERIDYNKGSLQYARTKVLDEAICEQYYSKNKELSSFIASSMVCTLGKGSLNDNGELIERSRVLSQGCISEAARSRGAVGKLCDGKGNEEDMIYEGIPDGPVVYEDAVGDVYIINDTRRLRFNNSKQNAGGTKKLGKQRRGVVDWNGYEFDDLRDGEEDGEDPKPTDPFDVVTIPAAPLSGENNEALYTPGICQNDHGGPLIGWRGGQELLVAVATMFKVDSKFQCMGPYLYTKVSCNHGFIRCIVDQKPPEELRRACDIPEEVGFEIIRRHISWVGHQDGPAANERIQIRHQLPLSALQPKL